MLYHLGDDYDDVKALADKYIDIVQVPGLYDQRYTDGSLPKKIMENVLGIRILLVHSMEKDVTPDDRMTADIILHGHSHHCSITLEDGLLCMNPGHLKGPRTRIFLQRSAFSTSRTRISRSRYSGLISSPCLPWSSVVPRTGFIKCKTAARRPS